MTVILLVILLYLFLTGVKGFFKLNSISIEEEAKKNGKTFSEMKNTYMVGSFLIHLAVVAVYAWIATIFNNSIVTLGASLAILACFFGLSKQLKRIEKGTLISKLSITSVYTTIFEGYVLYLILSQMFGWTFLSR